MSDINYAAEKLADPKEQDLKKINVKSNKFVLINKALEEFIKYSQMYYNRSTVSMQAPLREFKEKITQFVDLLSEDEVHAYYILLIIMCRSRAIQKAKELEEHQGLLIDLEVVQTGWNEIELLLHRDEPAYNIVREMLREFVVKINPDWKDDEWRIN